MNLELVLAGLVVGFVVGLTGMGGGALMTPIMVLLFGVEPLAAVSSDLVASLVMKPVGAGVHLKRGTVNRALVGWLVLGSVPSAFCGVLILKAAGGDDFQDRVKWLLGAVLLVAALAMVAKAALDRRRRDAGGGEALEQLRVRPLPTVAIGVVGGLAVGMTSVGSGSLMIVALLVLYPTLDARSLVGTDLVQAIPLVASASLGHLLYGDFRLGLTAWLLAGALPGVYAGARVSSRAPSHIIRPALIAVLAISALKLLGVGTGELGIAVGLAIVAFGALWLRRRSTARVALGAAEVAA